MFSRSFFLHSLIQKFQGYARALIQLAQREGSLNLLCTSKEAVKPLVETYSRMFSMPVTVGEATEEEIQEFIQQTYTSGKSSESETSDTNSGADWGFEKPDVFSWQAKLSCKILRLPHIVTRLKFLQQTSTCALSFLTPRETGMPTLQIHWFYW